MRRNLWAILVTVAVVASLAALNQGVELKVTQAQGATPFATNQADLGTPSATMAATEASSLGAQAAQQPQDGQWPSYGYTYEQTRHVPLTQINRDNVRSMGLIWQADFQQLDKNIPGGQEAFPLVVGDTLYTTTSFNHVFAFNAKTGKMLWHFSPGDIGKFTNFGLDINRGVGYCDNKVFMVTLDQRLISIDARSGNLVKQINIGDVVPDARSEYGYYQTQAPICYKNTLIIGSSGGDNGIRGYVMAFNPGDLSPAWPNPYWTVPPEGQDWRKLGRFHGGGAVWNSVTIDSTTDMVYFSVGNPSPDFFPQLRPGNNPNVNSVIAVDLKTGQEKWHQQQIKLDQWDYDTSTPPMVYTALINGQPRRVVSVGTKEGKVYVMDAQTGDYIYNGIQVVNLSNHPPLEPGKPVVIAPSSLGGVNYAPQAYDPQTNYMFVGTVESKTILLQEKSAEEVDKSRARGDVDAGAINGFGNTPKGWHDYGSVTAVDLNTGKIAWKTPLAEPQRGGVTTTASGLVFAGGGGGFLYAMDAKTGAILWQFQTGGPIASGPTIYQLDNLEYVAVTVGGTSTSSGGGKISKIEVFGLNGDPMQFAAQGVESQGVTPEEVLQQAQASASGGQFIQLDSKPKTVDLTVVAAFNSNNGSLNFNGYANGQATYTVPEGWTVKVSFKNVSSESPHSVIIVNRDNAKNVRVGNAVFNGAESPNPEAGITSGVQTFQFTAEKQGTYAMACGVPGHSAGGMWITFVVSDANAKPSIKLGDNPVFTPSSSGTSMGATTGNNNQDQNGNQQNGNQGNSQQNNSQQNGNQNGSQNQNGGQQNNNSNNGGGSSNANNGTNNGSNNGGMNMGGGNNPTPTAQSK